MSSDARAPIRRAILSVTDKTGLVDFAQKLAGMGVELISTGGTAKMLRDSGISVKDISELTGFPEMLDGRVKTLHPKVHGGILHRRENPSHRTAVAEHGIQPIDMVVVNLYAFEKTAAKPGLHFEELIENIDIGGPSMIRAAAKNFQDVAVVTSPEDYASISQALKAGNGILSREMLFDLSRKAFLCTARYDGQIAQYLSNVGQQGDFPPKIFMDFEKVMDLRYGENPHQRAAFYKWGGQPAFGLAAAKQLQGKELSYNNLVDVEAAWNLIREFDSAACCIIKHTNPCGTAIGSSLREAYVKAYEADPVSAFGSESRIVTKRKPADNEHRDLHFAWRVAKHVKSNAIVLAEGGRTVGVGAGQMSRVDSVRLSIEKARPTAKGAVLGSDAFFPFRDGIDEAAKAGITAIIQPGGSVRDAEVIEAADEHGMSMIFTGLRHFKH